MTHQGTTSPRARPWTDSPQSVYRLRPALRWLQWTAIVVGAIGVLVGFSVGGYRWYLAYTQYGPAVVWRWSAPWLAAGLGISPALVLGIISLLRTRGTALAIYPSGIVYRRGGILQQLPWPEIQSLTVSGPWSGMPLLATRGRPVALTISASDGRHLRLGRELAKFDELVKEIKGRVYPRLQRAYASAFNRGQPLRFGPLLVDPEGLQVGRRRLPWDRVNRADLRDGTLRITPKPGSAQPGLRVPAADVPNVDLCLQLIQGVLGRT